MKQRELCLPVLVLLLEHLESLVFAYHALTTVIPFSSSLVMCNVGALCVST